MCKDLIHQDATFMAETIRNGQTNSFELVSLHRERFRKFNSKLNGIVTFAENALEEAINADKEFKDGLIKGPLHGVPFTMKDVFDSAGIRTTRGSKLFADRIPKNDSEVVKRLKNAGGILIGKTNLPEFALAAETSGAIFDKGENPWMKGHTCGGSSGGEAISLSTGLSPLGVGSDLGGSNRLPAHYCGVVGFKPTQGRIPLTGHWPEMISRYFHAGPITRSVRDIVCSYHILSGYNGLDQYALPVPIKSKPTSDFKGLKIGWFDNEPYDPVDPQIRNAVQTAVEALELNHCTVEKISVPIIDGLSPIDATYVLLAGEGIEYLNKYVQGNELPTRYLAPEAIERRRFSEKTDVWAFGVTMWEILTSGKIPYFQIARDDDVISRVLGGGRLDFAQLVARMVYGASWNSVGLLAQLDDHHLQNLVHC